MSARLSERLRFTRKECFGQESSPNSDKTCIALVQPLKATCLVRHNNLGKRHTKHPSPLTEKKVLHPLLRKQTAFIEMVSACTVTDINTKKKRCDYIHIKRHKNGKCLLNSKQSTYLYRCGRLAISPSTTACFGKKRNFFMGSSNTHLRQLFLTGGPLVGLRHSCSGSGTIISNFQ